jgi:hypothetical protein
MIENRLDTLPIPCPHCSVQTVVPKDIPWNARDKDGMLRKAAASSLSETDVA